MAKETAPTNTNMDIWNAVQEADPSHTKKVNQRGGFTAIDAMYQLMRATEVFGSIGEGWGYDAAYDTIIGNSMVLVTCEVTIWHSGSRDKKFGPVMGMNAVINQKGHFDDDAPKKAMTDAITKGLSQMGFSADVFMGRYDDNKYLAALNQKFGTSPDDTLTPGAPRTSGPAGPGSLPSGQPDVGF